MSKPYNNMFQGLDQEDTGATQQVYQKKQEKPTQQYKPQTQGDREPREYRPKR